MSTPYEWRIDAIEQKAERACDHLWKLDSLSSDVANLERSVRELSACVAGLCATCEAQQNRIEQLERTVEQIKPTVT